MNECEQIADQLHRAFQGDAWHGPPLMELLKPVSSRQAAAHPVAGAHSIWEIVNHLIAWKNTVRRRMTGEVVELTAEQDWKPVVAVSDASWQSTVQELQSAHASLEEAVKQFGPQHLAEHAPNREHSMYVMLHGMVQHDLYHAGQIAILKKALK